MMIKIIAFTAMLALPAPLGAFADALNPDPLSSAAKALGLPQLRRVLAGKSSLEQAVADAKLQTRRYAKRQATWFRHQTPGWLRLDATRAEAGTLADEILCRIGGRAR